MFARPERLKKLQNAEKRQRRDTKKRGLKTEPVCVEALLIIQKEMCGCGCGKPLDLEAEWDCSSPPHGYPIIAHKLARGSLGEHTAKNVELWRHRCNKLAGDRENTEVASVKRHSVNKERKRPKSRWAKRNFPKGKSAWPKGRKIQSRGFK